MKLHDCLQGSTEWLNLRAGIPTASGFDRIITPGGKPSASAEKYLFTLLAERMMGRPTIEAVSTWMNRGQEMEQEAVDFYELTRELETVLVGFITNDEGTVGASPDRLVGDSGLLEIKVPAEHTHVSYLLKKSVDQAYYPQVQGQLWISERQWLDILSYHPEMPPALIRVERDEEFIGRLQQAIGEFSTQLEKYSGDLKQRGWIKAWPIPREIREDPYDIGASRIEFLSDEDLTFAKSLAQELPPAPIAQSLTTGMGDGMLSPDYSQDPPPPCPKCGGPTIFKPAGKFKATRWNDGWKCDRKPQNCKKAGVKGAWVDAAAWHSNQPSQDGPAPFATASTKGGEAPASSQPVPGSGEGQEQPPKAPNPPDLTRGELGGGTLPKDPWASEMGNLMNKNPTIFWQKLTAMAGSTWKIPLAIESVPYDQRKGVLETLRRAMR